MLDGRDGGSSREDRRRRGCRLRDRWDSSGGLRLRRDACWAQARAAVGGSGCRVAGGGGARRLRIHPPVSGAAAARRGARRLRAGLGRLRRSSSGQVLRARCPRAPKVCLLGRGGRSGRSSSNSWSGWSWDGNCGLGWISGGSVVVALPAVSARGPGGVRPPCAWGPPVGVLASPAKSAVALTGVGNADAGPIPCTMVLPLLLGLGAISEARPRAPGTGGLGSCGRGAPRAVGGLPSMFLGSRGLSSSLPASPVGRVGSGLRDGLAWPTGSGGTEPPLPGTCGPPLPGSGPPLLRASSSSASGGSVGLAENELESGVGEPD